MCTQDEVGAGQDDLLGVEDTARRGFFSSRPAVKNRIGLFAMGSRAAVLGQLSAPVIVPHAAGDAKLAYESIFRSLHVRFDTVF